MGRGSMHDILPQWQYANYLRETAQWTRDLIKSGAVPADELAKFERFKNRPDTPEKGYAESGGRYSAAKALLKRMVESNSLAKAGVTSSLGYNFYDLRPPVQLSYPVNVPFRNALPRMGRVNDGYGVAAHWKATRNPGSVYGGVAEGQRNAIATPDENDYIATYKEIGIERGVTFTAQFAGEGYADNVADEHLRGLHELWLQEEGLMLLGNDGSDAGNNGFKLATMNTPAGVQATTTGGLLVADQYVTAYCVAITALGNPNNAQYGYQVFPTVAGGLTPSYVRTNQDGSQTTVNGGTSQISAASSTVHVTGSNNSVVFTATAKKGAFAYAWYIDIENSNTHAAGTSLLAAITQFPTYTVLTTPAGTQAADATGLDADHSYQLTDFTGLLSYAASTSGATWTDLIGAGLTSQKNGRVSEVETVLQTIWSSYQAGVDTIWGSADAVTELDTAIRFGGTTASSYRFDYTRDSQNQLLGGFVVSAYQSRYTMNPNGYSIPIRIHPMLPPGTLFFDVSTNPYPHSRAPFVRGMLVQRDYYSIEWPLVTRQWTFGTYVHEVLAHNFPWISAVLTGIGPFTQT